MRIVRWPARAFFTCALLVGWSIAHSAGQSNNRINNHQPPPGEWRVYGGDQASTKYSPLTQINATNASQLKVVWRWKSPDADIVARHPGLTVWKYEATPIMIAGVLYTSTSLSQVAAIEASTGKTLWFFDPQIYAAGVTPFNIGIVHRGVAYWSNGQDSRILIGTGDDYLIALDAKTGKPISSFGKKGRVDLTLGLGRPIDRKLYRMTSPPIICRNTVIIGSAISDIPVLKRMPPGGVRGFDVRTGKLRWTFHTVPQGHEYGVNTWGHGSWKTFGSANVWAPMSADDALGYVYLPVSTPSSDFYGGRRPGNGLFGDSLVCLEAATGRRVWHYQLLHHGVWDYDPPAAPILADIHTGARTKRAVVQVTKQGFAYVFDRVTGRPLWPIVERRVPQSLVPGEHTSATQPIPTLPKAFDRQGFTLNDLIDLSPALNQQARAFLQDHDYGPLFTPPHERGTVVLPGSIGGASWAGAAYDEESGFLYVPSITRPELVALKLNPPEAAERYEAAHSLMGIPITKPPWGRVTAINLHDGEHVWMQPMGNGYQDQPAIRSLKMGQLGAPERGFPLVTKTLLFIALYRGSDRRRKYPGGISRSRTALVPCRWVRLFFFFNPDKSISLYLGCIAF